MKKILYIPLFAIVLCSCPNQSKKDHERALREFDSISKSLDKPADSGSTDILKALRDVENSLKNTGDLLAEANNILYDSLEVKFKEGYGHIRQMRYKVEDFRGYLSELKRQFYKACGDSTGQIIPRGNENKISLTNKFFLEKGLADYLLPNLKEVRASFLSHSKNPLVIEKANKLTEVPMRPGFDKKDFMKGHFYNTPPMAAVTILNFLEYYVRSAEREILNDYLKQ